MTCCGGSTDGRRGRLPRRDGGPLMGQLGMDRLDQPAVTQSAVTQPGAARSRGEQARRRSSAGTVPAPRAGGRGVLEGAFALLGALERAEGAGLTRLAAECGLPKTTAYRLLEQMTRLGAVERSGDGYRIGSRVFQLGHGWQPYPGLRSAAREPVRRLAAATRTAVAVSVLRNGRTLILDWVPGEGGLSVSLRPGVTWPWPTAAGKVLVAVAGGEPPPVPVQVPAAASWRQEAAAIRAAGVAFDREEVVPGVCCAAVPLYGPAGVPVASLCVLTDPAHRLDRLADAALRAGRAISAALGGR